MTEFTPGPGWWKASDGEWYPPRWEYRTIDGSLLMKSGRSSFASELDEAGAAGWELVSVIGEPNKVAIAYLRRPLRS